MLKFDKIHGFKGAVKYARQRPDRFSQPVNFQGTVKLHGTNAGVLVYADGRYEPQSRNRTLTLDSDNQGFAAWALRDDVREAITKMAAGIRAANGDALGSAAYDCSAAELDLPIVIYGEWVGPGIQSGVAVNQLPKKQFVTFAAAVPVEGEPRYLDAAVTLYLLKDASINLRSITEVEPRYISVDLLDRASCVAAVDELNPLTLAVDELCPWGALHGLEGVGEGYVWTAEGSHHGNPALTFKVKGERHGEKGASKRATTSAPNLETVDRFVVFAVTDDRCRQAVEHLREAGTEITMKNTRAFLDTLRDDIVAECADELAASELEWGQVQKAVTSVAITYWKGVAQ